MSLEKRRVTVKLKCPNPLFEQWLTTWKDQAIANDSKMQYTFNHALTSLRKYPLPLNSGRECKILKGFGSKLCKMMDDKLLEYQQNKEKTTVLFTDDFSAPDSEPNEPLEKAKNENKKLQRTVKTSTGSAEKRTGTKQYVPQYGSGSYAILVSLYKQSIQPNYAGHLTKDEIIHLGKDLSNTSFSKPMPGSRYSAWSSMRILLMKHLVTKFGRPAKFSLTAEGLSLAQKLYTSSDQNPPNTDFSSLGNDFEMVDDVFTNMSDNSQSGDNYNDILESHANLESPKEVTNILPSFENPKNCEAQIPYDFKFDFDQINDIPNSSKAFEQRELINAKDMPSENDAKRQKIVKSTSTSSISNQKENIEGFKLFHQKTQKTFKKYSTDTVLSICSLKKDDLPPSSTHSLKKHASTNSVTSTNSSASVFEDFVMEPLSFDIILYVDTNETSGSLNYENDEILHGLKSFGIKYEIKNLKVGDFTWICRDRIFNKELILPYIIERKRMDDFAQSIKDKRYYEQKFRLKKSGIENLTYLVESHGRNQHLGLPLQTLYQAATNTAIQENFFIKFTEDTKETVEYLVNFSKILIQMFKSKTLASCSKLNMQPIDINTHVINLMTFKEFNEASVKNKKAKVTELFVKMLIQIKGMSVERALAIVQSYPTPRVLKNAYDTNPEDINETLLSNIKYGTCGKSIGAVLSKTVYQVFSKINY